MKVEIYYKHETRLDVELLENVSDIITYEDEIDFIYNNSKTQYENGIEIRKSIPRELINVIVTQDF